MRGSAFAAGLACVALPASAGAVSDPRTVVTRANVDADRARELVVRTETARSVELVVIDRCRGKPRRHVIVRAAGTFVAHAVTDMDAVTTHAEIFVATRTSSVTNAKIIRFVGGGRTCARPRALLEFSSMKPTSFRVRPASYFAKRVNVVEREAECAWKTTEFEFDRELRTFAPKWTLTQTRDDVPAPADLAPVVATLRTALPPLCPRRTEWSLLGARAHAFANPHLVIYFFEFESEAEAASVEIASKNDVMIRGQRGAHLDWVPGFEPVWFRAGRFLVLADRMETAAVNGLRSILGPELVPTRP